MGKRWPGAQPPTKPVGWLSARTSAVPQFNGICAAGLGQFDPCTGESFLREHNKLHPSNVRKTCSIIYVRFSLRLIELVSQKVLWAQSA